MLNAFARIIARFRGVTKEDYEGEAGDKYRKGVRKISEYCVENGLDPDSLVKDAANYIKGAANEKQAHVIKEFAESEKTRTEEELLRRTIESKIAKEEAEAFMAQVKAADALADLIKKLNDLKVAGILVDESTFRVGQMPEGMMIGETIQSLRTDKIKAQLSGATKSSRIEKKSERNRAADPVGDLIKRRRGMMGTNRKKPKT